MRQAGIVAAAALHALDHHLERLADDHARAAKLAAAIRALPGLELVNPPVETNLVFFATTGTGWSAPALSEALAAAGVRIGAMGPATLRACTHLDVDDAGIATAIEALRRLVAG
jgi:threonine aldolase